MSRPYTFARRMSTLDHLTKGRIGWNVVTGYLDSAARGMGLVQQPEHDSRYDVAEEYMQVVYQLWEGSWEDRAVLRDRDSRQFADPARIHRVKHEGPHYKVDAIHLSEPSPQRTPVLYQAGASDRGRAFAAAHAECIFVNGQFRHNVRDIVADIRARPKASAAIRTTSRCSSAPPLWSLLPRRRRRTSWPNTANTPVLKGRWRTTPPRSASISPAMGPTSRSASSRPMRCAPTWKRSPCAAGTEWTLRKLMHMMVLGSRQAPIVGSPSQVADQMQAWVSEADVDGFNLSRTVIPECVQDFIALVVPELQSRGMMKRPLRARHAAREAFGPGADPAAGEHIRRRHAVAAAEIKSREPVS